MSARVAPRNWPVRINRAIERWLTAPEANAAGRVGLFRILFGVFYLWIIHQTHFVQLAQVPAGGWTPVFFFGQWAGLPSALFLQVCEFVLVSGLLLLIVGYRVRPATLIVLIAGALLEGFRYSFGKVDHDSMFMVFYMPLFMVFGQWGDTYSLDATLRRRQSAPTPSPSDSSWRFIWPVRAALLMLSALFISAAYWKLADGWLRNPDVLANLLLQANVSTTASGGAARPLLTLLPQMPALTTAMQFGVILFELVFFLALVSRKLRDSFVSLAIIFHALNTYLLNVSFGPLLIVYALFVDWQGLYERWFPASFRRLRLSGVSTRWLAGGAPAIAVALALLWVQTPFLRDAMHLGGLLNSRRLWYVLVPFALIVLVRNSLKLIQRLRLRGAALSAVERRERL